MTTRLRTVWIAVCAVVLTSGCAATDVGNPEDGARDAGEQTVDVRVRFEGLKRAPDPAAIVLADGTEIRAVWIGASRPGLRRQGDCGERAESTSGTTFAVDLLADDGERKVDVPNRPVGTYCGFDLDLDQVSESDRPSGAPEALVGRSILVVGERSDGTRFEIRGEFEPGLALLRHGTGFAVDADRRDLLVSFAMQNWIDTEALEAIEGESPIIVDRESHTDVFEPFREAFAQTVFLLRDADANGRSVPSEREDILASTLPEEERQPEGEDEEDAGVEESD